MISRVLDNRPGRGFSPIRQGNRQAFAIAITQVFDGGIGHLPALREVREMARRREGRRRTEAPLAGAKAALVGRVGRLFGNHLDALGQQARFLFQCRQLVVTEVGERNTQAYAFNRKWLSKRGLKPDTLSVISVRGDSMEPDLNDGDLVLIDLGNTELSDGKIYAVQYSGNLFVKRIQYVPGDTVRLVSRNAQYSPIEIKTPEADGVRVVGRVVASMHEW
ncbi:S24 family peptidase [Tritonibacter horizontis]|uniref:S24 family peptidase n=1 Tax=Tritonibacter horizontis TaxID=1768241 RepID=UPI0038CD12A3